MIRKVILLLSALACFVNVSNAQFCGTVPIQDKLLKQHPELAEKVAAYGDKLEKEINQRINHMNLGGLARVTGDSSDSITYVIPVVVHVIHDYGTEDVTEDQIATMLKNLNDFYQLRNDTSSVIDVYKKYVGKMNFIFRMATKDPQGNPTRGITRRYNYLTYGGDNQAKFDEWNPRSYMNIWVEAYIGLGAEGGGIVAAYAQFPSFGAVFPYYDGLMVNSQFIGITGDGDGATVPHEVGHYFNLLHPFGNSNEAYGPCDTKPLCSDDFVDDTPPTHGHFCCNCNYCPLDDTACASGYFKIYPSVNTPGVDSLVDYPDTTNVQNIMDYATCKMMFTKGQVARARAAAQSDVGGRDSLWKDFNLFRTGANTATLPLIPPTADFAIQNSSTFPVTQTSLVNHFLCEGKPFRFRDFSWNDTITSLQWNFTDGSGAVSTATGSVINQSFTNPGWVNVSLTAVGKHGSDTLVKNDVVYVADPTAINPIGYYEEFTPGTGGDLSKWPIFNYYNNNFQWMYQDGYGYYDKSCIKYNGFDTRVQPANFVGSPKLPGLSGGDFDDLFSPAFDLSSMPVASLNFMYAGATRTGNPTYMTDSLEISYSTDCGTTWKNLTWKVGKDLANDGQYGIAFGPLSGTDWSLFSMDLPTAAKTSNTYFRFRYHPGYDDELGVSTSNDFYMDRFNISNFPAGLNTLVTDNRSIAVAPNPTSSNAYVIIKNNSGSEAVKVEVTDITGKQIYHTEAQVNGMGNIEIPASALVAKGIYLVKIAAGSQVETQKLVVY